MGYNPVTIVQRDIANTLKGGLAAFGNRPLEQSKLDLQKAQMLYEIGRNKLADERAGRRLELEEGADLRAGEAQTHNIEMANARNTREAAEAARKKALYEAGALARVVDGKQTQRSLQDFDREEGLRNEQVTWEIIIPYLFGDNPSRETITDFTANKKPQKLMKITGGRIDEDGKFWKADGKPVTGVDIRRILSIAGPIWGAGADPGHKLNQKIREYEDLVKKNGGVGTPEDEAKYEQMLKAKKDPKWLIGEYEKQRNRIRANISKFEQMKVSTTSLKDDLSRIDRKIAKQEGTLSARAKNAAAIHLQKIKSAGQMMGSLEKDSHYLSTVAGEDKDGNKVLTEREAANIIRFDKAMGDRLRGAYQEIKLLENLELDEGPLMDKIKEIKKSWGLDPASLKKSQKAAKQTDPNPDKLDFTKTKELLVQ